MEKKSKCPSVLEWIKKNVVKEYSATNRGEILPFAIPQRNQEDVTISELSQAQKGEHRTISPS